jgi:hypothetical protein
MTPRHSPPMGSQTAGKWSSRTLGPRSGGRPCVPADRLHRQHSPPPTRTAYATEPAPICPPCLLNLQYPSIMSLPTDRLFHRLLLGVLRPHGRLPAVLLPAAVSVPPHDVSLASSREHAQLLHLAARTESSPQCNRSAEYDPQLLGRGAACMAPQALRAARTGPEDRDGLLGLPLRKAHRRDLHRAQVRLEPPGPC